MRDVRIIALCNQIMLAAGNRISGYEEREQSHEDTF
jgi:hypothetical protein